MMCLETKTKAEIDQVWNFSLPTIFRWRARKGHRACARSLVAERKAIPITQHSRQDGRLVRVVRSGKTWPASESHGQISPCWVQGQVWWPKAGQLGRIGHILSDWLAARSRRHATSESPELFRDKFNEVEDNVRMHR